MEASLGEIRREVAPVFRAAAEAVDEDNYWTVSRTGNFIMDAMAINHGLVVLDAGAKFMEVHEAVDIADGPQPETDGGNEDD
jgi:hypothetical protein